jgi:beta-glucosidase
MSGVELAGSNPIEGGTAESMDIKEAVVHVLPLTPELTPANTPENQSPSRDDIMTGKKIFGLEKPDDRARALAAKLSLEEQVCFCFTLHSCFYNIPDLGRSSRV